MSATILPGDEMINVLTDAIVSKRHTIELMEKSAKEAQADLTELRTARAKLLAKAAGFDIGQVWIVSNYRRDHRLGVIYGIRPAYGGSCGDERNDWLIDVAFSKRDSQVTDAEAIGGRDATRECVGQVERGALRDSLQDLLHVIQQRESPVAKHG